MYYVLDCGCYIFAGLSSLGVPGVPGVLGVPGEPGVPWHTQFWQIS